MRELKCVRQPGSNALGSSRVLSTSRKLCDESINQRPKEVVASVLESLKFGFELANFSER